LPWINAGVTLVRSLVTAPRRACDGRDAGPAAV